MEFEHQFKVETLISENRTTFKNNNCKLPGNSLFLCKLFWVKLPPDNVKNSASTTSLTTN